MLRKKENPTPSRSTPPPSTNPNPQSSPIILQTFIDRTSAKLSEMKGRLQRRFLETGNEMSTSDNDSHSSPIIDIQERTIAIPTPSSSIMPPVAMTKDFKIDSFGAIRPSHTSSGTGQKSYTPATSPSEDHLSSELDSEVGALKVRSHNTSTAINKAEETYQTPPSADSNTFPHTYDEWKGVVVDKYLRQLEQPSPQSTISSKPGPWSTRLIQHPEYTSQQHNQLTSVMPGKNKALLLPSQLFGLYGDALGDENIEGNSDDNMAALPSPLFGLHGDALEVENIEENSDDNMAALLIEAIEEETSKEEVEGEDEEQDEKEESHIFRDPVVHEISSDSDSDSSCSVDAALAPADTGLRNVIATNPPYPLYPQSHIQSHENGNTIPATDYYKRVAEKMAKEAGYHSEDYSSVLPSNEDDQYQNGNNSHQSYQHDEIMEESNVANSVQEDKTTHTLPPYFNKVKRGFNWNRGARQPKSRYRIPTPAPITREYIREPTPSPIPENPSTNSKHEGHRSKRARHHYDTTRPAASTISFAEAKVQYLTANPPKHWAYGTIVPPEEWPIGVQEEHIHGVSQFYTDKRTGIPLFLGTIPYDVYYAQNSPASLLTAQMAETIQRIAPKTQQYINETRQNRKRSYEMDENDADDADTTPAKRQRQEVPAQYNTSKYVPKPPVATTGYITVSERLIVESKARMQADIARIQEEMERRKQAKLIEAQAPEYNHFINTPSGSPLAAENLASLPYPRPSETLYNNMYYGRSPLQHGDQHEAFVNALQNFEAEHRLDSSDPRFLARLESPSEESVTLCGDGYEADEERESESEDRYAAQFDNGYTNYQHRTTQNQHYRDASPIIKYEGDGYQTEESDEYDGEAQVFKREDSDDVQVFKIGNSDEYDTEEQEYNEEDDEEEYDGEGEYLNIVEEGRRYLEQKDW